MEKQEKPALEVVIDGRRTVIKLESFNGREVKDFRGEVGFAPTRAFREPGLMDIDVIAAFVWIERRRLKPTLTYDDVLDSINYENMEIVGMDATDDEVDIDDPEA